MVCSNPHDALVEQVLVKTKRSPWLINEMIRRIEKRVTEATSELEKTERRLSILKARLNAAKDALEIAEREQN